MTKKIIPIFVALTLTSCASIKEKISDVGRKACTGNETGKTLSDIFFFY